MAGLLIAALGCYQSDAESHGIGSVTCCTALQAMQLVAVGPSNLGCRAHSTYSKIWNRGQGRAGQGRAGQGRAGDLFSRRCFNKVND